MAPSRRPQARAEAKLLHDSISLSAFPVKPKPSAGFNSLVPHPVAGKINSKDIESTPYSDVAFKLHSPTLRRKRPQWKPRPKMPPQSVNGCPIFDGILNSVQWEKVLWKRQGYADNFVPTSFLESLIDRREPEKTRAFSILPIVSVAMVMAQNLSLLVLQGLLVVMSKDNAGASMNTTVLDVRVAVATLFLFGFSIWLYCGRPVNPILWPNTLSNLCWLPVIAVRMLAHFQNVTFISRSSSYFCCLILASIHFVFFNYSVFSCSSDDTEIKSTRPLYLSFSHTAIGAMVALSPSSSQHLDLQLYLAAFVIFGVSPRFRRAVAQGSIAGHATLTALIVFAPLSILSVCAADGNHQCCMGLIAFVAVLVLVCCLGPWGYIWAHCYKVRRNGPWEIAKVEQEHPSLM